MPEQPDVRRCPGPGCAARIPSDRLACRDHWFQVPPATRSKVWRAWRALLSSGDSELEAQVAADRHAAAKREAIATMRPLEPAP